MTQYLREPVIQYTQEKGVTKYMGGIKAYEDNLNHMELSHAIFSGIQRDTVEDAQVDAYGILNYLELQS